MSRAVFPLAQAATLTAQLATTSVYQQGSASDQNSSYLIDDGLGIETRTQRNSCRNTHRNLTRIHASVQPLHGTFLMQTVLLRTR
ncbi:hypothetical protein M2157_009578 [Streptomyces sp. SAI-127]|nr:hypothetical protein [Streptomyces sp. SAI-127]